jgi:Abnormal spindle-like microcephaly-assoc'd, ASPM-SPD-2-Hydin
MVQMRLVCLVGLFVFGLIAFSPAAHASLGVSPSAVSFGSVTVNSSSTAATIVVTNTSRQSVTLESISNGSAEFVVTGAALPVALGAHQSISFQVVFRPNAASAFSTSIRFTAGRRGGISTAVTVSGTGIAPPPPPAPATYLLSPSTGGLAFGKIQVGTGASQAITLTNTGTGSVNISQVTPTGAGFSVAGFSSAVTLAAGQSLSLSASFAPASAGSVTGSIAVVSTATNSPAAISLSGTGIQPLISVVPASVSFGSVTVGVTNSQTMTIQNPGSANLTITQAAMSGTGYSLSGLALPVSIAPGGTAAFNVAFAPAAGSSYPSILTLVSNAPNSPSSISVSGTGIAPVLQISASPASLSFGSLTTGASATQNVTLTNTGNSSVSISQIVASGTGFSTSAIALPISLAAGQSTSFSVAFAPASAGSLAGSVTVTSNATNSPLTVTLAGTGTAPVTHAVTLSWTPGSSSYEGFNVYRGAASGGPYSRVDASMVSNTSYIDSNVTGGQTYYYVATEVDSTGTESGYSSEVSAVIP